MLQVTDTVVIPDSELEIFEGGGHLFLLSHREQSISVMRLPRR